MRNFTTTEKSAIKHIMSQAGWSVLMSHVEEVLIDSSKQPVKADTEFETLWRTAQREAKVDVLKGFFNNLDEEVLK